MDETTLNELARSARALLLLQLQARTEGDDKEKPELTLARAGYNAKQIAELLGKKQGSVSKTIQRARKAG